MMLCCGCRFRSLVAAPCVGSFLEAWCALFWGSQIDFFSVCCFVVFSSQIFSSVVSTRSLFFPSLWDMCRSFCLCRSEQTVLPTRWSWSLLILVLRLLATRSPVSAGWRSHDFLQMSTWLLVPASVWRKIVWRKIVWSSVVPFSPLCVVCILVSVDVTWYNAFLTSLCLQTSFKLASAVQIVVIQQCCFQNLSSFCTISGSCSLPHLLHHFCSYITACSIS